MTARPLSPAQVRELDRLATLGVSLARKNDRTLLSLAERGLVEYRQYRWHPTRLGLDTIAPYRPPYSPTPPRTRRQFPVSG